MAHHSVFTWFGPVFASFTFQAAYAQIQFEDISDSSGVSSVSSETWGASWGDYDGDGRPDIFVNNHRNLPSLFQNDANNRFTDIAVGADLAGKWLQVPEADQHMAAWADYDNDGDQDVYITGNDGWLFENVPAGLMYRPGAIPVPSFAGNSALWFDHNNDGLLDLKSPGWHRGTRTNTPLIEQQADGRFVELATSSRIGEDCGTLAGLSNAIANELRAGYIADINDDGLAEFICLLKSGSFAEGGIAYTYGDGVADKLTGIPTGDKVRDAVIADFDGDLKQDILLVNGVMRPTDAHQPDANTIEALLTVTGPNVKVLRFAGTGVVNFDISWNVGDTGKKSNPQNYIYIGSGGTRPTTVNFSLDSADPANWGLRNYNPASDNIMLIGYDPDKGEWLIVQPGGGKTQQNYLILRNDNGLTINGIDGLQLADGPIMLNLYMNTDPGFADEAWERGLRKELCATVVAGDFDNDMDQDLILGCRGGSQNIANVVYENQGDGNFIRVENPVGVEGIVGGAVTDGAGTTESLVVADYDVDGFLDVFATNGMNLQPKGVGGPHQLFHNVGNGNHWLEFDFAGVASNRDGVGAKVYVTTPDGTVQLREQKGGYHRWSQDHMRLHVGLAGHTEADITVYWPSGTIDLYSNVAADSLYRVNEGGALEAVTLGEPRPYKCNQPEFRSSEDHGLIIWKNCYNDTWNVRGVGGGIDTLYTGTIRVGVGAIEIIGTTSIEADDAVSVLDGELSFSFRSGTNGQDGVAFRLPAGVTACFESASDTGAPLLLGVNKRPYASSFNLSDLGPCRSPGNFFTGEFVDSSAAVASLAAADALLADGGVDSSTVALTRVDFKDSGGTAGRFSQEQLFPYTDTFAARITGEFVVDAAGAYTFGTNSDDGVRLRVNGADVIVDDSLHGPEDRFGTVNLAAGTHTFELVFFENTGGAALELFMAPGTYTSYSGVFSLLTPPPLPDTDGDGYNDVDDAFPDDPAEWLDSDLDGVGDNGDAFPNDASESADTDGDGVGNNEDAFPDDPSETVDSDEDGVGDNGDLYPYNPNESADTDGDGVGDNADAFPLDPTETVDRDGDGIGDNADPYPDDPNNDASVSCREPAYDRFSEAATFLWEDCDGSNRWHLRVTGGGTPVTLAFRGLVESTGGVAPLTGYSLEASDVLDVSVADELSYTLYLYNVGEDGFDFTAAPGSCFIPVDTGLPVYLGEGRTLLATADLDLDELGACPEPADTDGDGLSDADEAALGTNPNVADTDGGGVSDGEEVANGTNPLDAGDDNPGLSDVCGEPLLNNGTDRGQYLWRECGGPNDGTWHLRALGGGTPVNITFGGEVQSAGGVTDLAGVSLEGSDVLAQDTAGDPAVLSWALRVWNTGVDGFDFVAPANACFVPEPGEHGVYLGVNRVALTGENLDLTTIGACAGQSDVDGDGLTDGDETTVYGTDPNVADTDLGGVNDGYEITNGTNPLDGADDYSAVADSDGDGLTYAEELALGTDPANPDTDGEGLTDGDEVNVYGTNPLERNTDKDGINDNVEIWWKGTDPLNPDTDGDGLTDGAEASNSGLGTDPLNPDTDGGGTNDGTEVANGTDPFNPLDD